jgi:hypothetical protein
MVQTVIGLNEKHFFGQVTPQPAQPMQLSGLAIVITIRVESVSSSTRSSGPRTDREQAL